MEEVNDSRSALQCLLEGQDYAGALELLGNLGHMVDRQLGLGVRAFRQTRPQVRPPWRLVACLSGHVVAVHDRIHVMGWQLGLRDCAIIIDMCVGV